MRNSWIRLNFLFQHMKEGGSVSLPTTEMSAEEMKERLETTLKATNKGENHGDLQDPSRLLP